MCGWWIHNRYTTRQCLLALRNSHKFAIRNGSLLQYYPNNHMTLSPSFALLQTTALVPLRPRFCPPQLSRHGVGACAFFFLVHQHDGVDTRTQPFRSLAKVQLRRECLCVLVFNSLAHRIIRPQDDDNNDVDNIETHGLGLAKLVPDFLTDTRQGFISCMQMKHTHMLRQAQIDIR